MTDTHLTEGALRVWHIPQIPGEPFHVSVVTVAEAMKLVDVLAQYDLFQFENRIKPDYCNMSGIERVEDGEWCEVDVEWELEQVTEVAP